MLDSKLLSSFQQKDTPFFYYDLELLQQTLDEIKKHGISKGYKIHFAFKSNNNPKVLELVRKAGLGADCVSGNEVQLAIDQGFEPKEIAFAGVGKTDAEIRIGLEHDIYCFNTESLQEIEVINELAEEMGKRARIALRINPNVDAKTHRYITTGLKENKFGINESDLEHILTVIKTLDHIDVIGIHFHIGSQIIDLEPFTLLAKRASELAGYIQEQGFPLKHINVGGGLGIDYDNPDAEPIPDFETYFNEFEKYLELKDGQELHFEIGRAIVGQCGSLISRVLYIKEGTDTTFAILDAGMSELIRPALYEAEHHIDVLSSNGEAKVYDVVGPICETSDTFRSRMELPILHRGDIVAIRSSGAYAEVMISNYNLRPKVGIVYSDEL